MLQLRPLQHTALAHFLRLQPRFPVLLALVAEVPGDALSMDDTSPMLAPQVVIKREVLVEKRVALRYLFHSQELLLQLTGAAELLTEAWLAPGWLQRRESRKIYGLLD